MPPLAQDFISIADYLAIDTYFYAATATLGIPKNANTISCSATP